MDTQTQNSLRDEPLCSKPSDYERFNSYHHLCVSRLVANWPSTCLKNYKNNVTAWLSGWGGLWHHKGWISKTVCWSAHFQKSVVSIRSKGWMFVKVASAENRTFDWCTETLLPSHPVVVDQLVGLHFVLRSDGPLGLDLHPAVVTSVKVQTLNKSDKMTDEQQQQQQQPQNNVAVFIQVSWCRELTCMCGHALSCASGRTLGVMRAVSRTQLVLACTQSFTGLFMTLSQQWSCLAWRIWNNKTLKITPRVMTWLHAICELAKQRIQKGFWKSSA